MISEDFTLLPCPARPRSTTDYEGCAEHRIVGTDRAINALAATIFARLGTQRKQGRFTRAERTWLAYRRTTCESRSDVYYGGSAADIVFAKCVADMNRVHLQELRAFAHDLRSK